MLKIIVLSFAVVLSFCWLWMFGLDMAALYIAMKMRTSWRGRPIIAMGVLLFVCVLLWFWGIGL